MLPTLVVQEQNMDHRPLRQTNPYVLNTRSYCIIFIICIADKVKMVAIGEPRYDTKK